MPLPGNVGTGRVYGTFTNDDGTPGVGTVSFIPPVDVPVLLDASDNVIVVLNQLDVRLDENGQFDVDLIATDDPDLNPNDWMWLVRIKLAGKAPYHFYIDMPEGSSRNIADIAGVPSFTNPQIVALPGIPGPEVGDGNKGDIEIIDGRWMIGLYTTEEYNLRAGGSEHWTVEAGSKVGWFDPTDGSFYLGQNLIANIESGDGGRMMPDFVWDGPGLRLRTRNITCAMIADPCDLNMQRYGPDSGGYPYGGPDPPYSFDNLTGLGAGALVAQVRGTPALVPYGGDSDTPGGRAESTNVVLSMACTDMPRKATTDSQTSNGGAFDLNIAPRNSHDFRQTYLRIDSQGFTRLGNRAVEEGNTTALVNIRVHEGDASRQRIEITGSPTGGSYKIRYYAPPVNDTSFSAEVDTANINHNAAATGANSVQTRLVDAIKTLAGDIPNVSPATAWSSVSNADVLVTGSFPTYDVEFAGLLADQPMFRMLMVDKAFTGGTSPNGSISRLNQQGIKSQKGLHILRLTGCLDGTGDYLRVVRGSVAGGVVAQITAAEDFVLAGGDVSVAVAGKGLKVREGSNAKMGIATLVGGTVTVNTTAVGASSRIFLTSQTSGGTPGSVGVSARVNGTSFTITSTSGTDTSQVAWMIVDPASGI
jgi:hypothetical protein